METSVSTVCFQSNVYPINGSCHDDRVFQSKVRAPYALKLLRDRHCSLTPIQQQEHQYSVHCSYAPENDYPWGTIRDAQGQEKVVCRCLNTDCSQFRRCRPDFDPSELRVLEENERVRQRIFSVEKSAGTLLEYTEPAAPPIPESEKILNVQIPEPEETVPLNKTEFSQEPQTNVQDDPFMIPDPASLTKPSVRPTSAQDENFHTFAEVSQADIIQAGVTERSIVNAGPGTGKTWMLIEKVIRMINENETDAENILILCFSNAAVGVVKARLAEAAGQERIGYEWQDIEVRTFDSFASTLLIWVQKNLRELLPKSFILESLGYNARIREAVKILLKQQDLLASYEHIFIDEVQDLVGERAQLVLEMLKSLPETCGFTLLGDTCQSLYDYMAADTPGVMSSSEFYDHIFSCFPDACYVTVTGNHRQGDQLRGLTIEYRRAILKGSARERSAAARTAFANIPAMPGKMQQFTKEDALPYVRQGTLGILTRTNGQALQISAWLRNAELPHTLQRGVGGTALADWIARIFCGYGNETINCPEFIARHTEVFPEAGEEISRKRWLALVDAQQDNPGGRYEISDILRGLLHGVKEPVLYESGNMEQPAITVSNIHRAKGKEFDSVIVIDDLLDVNENAPEDELLEHKVCYVALTRPKKRIEHVKFPSRSTSISSMKDEVRRCFRPMYRKKYINNFEVGVERDLDERSFAADNKIQQYIQETLEPGTRLKLIKCNGSSYPIYSLVVEDHEQTVLGCTSREFAADLETAIRTIRKNSDNILCPHAFCDIYADRVITCVSALSSPPGATRFGNVAIWYGLKIAGFAAVDKDTY